MAEMTSAYDKTTKKEIKIKNITKFQYQDELLCYCCNKPVISKAIGSDYMEAHFAHAKQDKTEVTLTRKQKKELMQKYGETLLHKRAKEYIAELKKIEIPLKNQKIENQKTDYNGEIYYPDEYSNPKDSLNIINSFLETKRIDIIPDVILKVNKNNHIFELFIEIYVTHKVDLIKEEKIKNNNQNCIQINLKDFDLKKLDDISYFQKEMININNYKYINLNYAGLEKQYNLNEKYLQLFEKHNDKIINQREYFIKLATSKDKIIKIQDSDIKTIYKCLCCNNEMGSNKTNYFHIEKSNCIIFENKKNAGILYSQKLIGNIFLNSLKYKLNLGLNLDLVLEDKILLNKNNQCIKLINKDLNREFTFIICFEIQNYISFKRIGYSVVNLIEWKNYQNMDFIEKPETLLEFNYSDLEELESQTLKVNQRKNENQNNIHINLCIDNDKVINKTEIEENKKYKCILCQNTIINHIHEEINNCLIFNDSKIDNTNLLIKNQNNNNKYYIFFNYLKEKLTFQEIDYGYILSKIKIDFLDNSEYLLDCFLKNKYLLKLKDINLIDKNIQIVFEDKNKKEKIFYIKINDNFFFAIYNMVFSVNLENSNIIENKRIEDFFVNNFSEIHNKETKEINELIIEYNNIRKENYENLIKHLNSLGKSCKNKIHLDIDSLELRLKKYKNIKIKNYLYDKKIVVNNIEYKINTIKFELDNQYNIKNILINNNILIKKGIGKCFFNSFFENIYEGEKEIILATTKDFDKKFLTGNIFYLPEDFTNNLNNSKNHIREIIKTFFPKNYYEEMLKSKDLSEDFFNYYNNNFNELKEILDNENNELFFKKIILNINSSLSLKMKSININKNKQKNLFINNLQHSDFELFFNVFDNIEIFTEEEQRKILVNNIFSQENKSFYIKNKSKILTYNFLENEVKNNNKLANYMLNVKNGQEINLEEFDEIIKGTKLRFGKTI